jgi:chorismate mutase
MTSTHTATHTADAARPLAELRGDIQQVDARLVALIAERARLARAVGEAKRRLALPLVDEAREQAVLRHATELARASGLDAAAVADVFRRLIQMSRDVQAE